MQLVSGAGTDLLVMVSDAGRVCASSVARARTILQRQREESWWWDTLVSVISFFFFVVLRAESRALHIILKP